MPKRFAAIWFRHLAADYQVRKDPSLKEIPFVLASPVRGRMVVQAVNDVAQSRGVHPNMVVADCRAILPELKVMNYDSTKNGKIIKSTIGMVYQV